jgi:hypothetical protein
MTSKWGGVRTVAVASAVSTCGLFMLGGVAPSTTSPPADSATGDTIDPDPIEVATSTAPTESTSVATTSPPTTSTTTTTATTPTTTATPTTSTAATTTATPTSTTSLPGAMPPTVTASGTTVGVGGTVTFEGSCHDAAGPVVIWIIKQADGSTEVVDTGLSTSQWTYTWTAPADERDASSFVFRFWCGTPADDAGGAPTDRRARVDMVASAAPPATPAPGPSAAPGVPTSVGTRLPETD